MSRLQTLLDMYEKDQQDTFITYAIAIEYSTAAESEQAITWFDKTLQIDDCFGYAYYHKARLLSESDADAARETLQLGMQKAAGDNADKARSEMSELLASL